MATEIEIIEKVRRRVADYTEDRKYDDNFYKDAIEQGIQTLNYDFEETYATVPDVPTNRIFLLVKVATIQMCWMRASEGAEGGSELEAVNTKYTSIAVPDLSVTDGNASNSRGPGYWLKLAGDIQKEYDKEVGQSAGQNTGGVAEVGYSQRISLTNGGFRKRNIDEGLPTVTLSTTVDGSDVLLEWTKLRREDFLYYEIVKASLTTFKNEEVVKQETDIHVTEFIDEDVTSGTWYYRVKSVNPNRIKTKSNSATATVV